MPKKVFLIALFFWIHLLSAQEKMTAKDGKSYPATSVWEFICENYALTGSLKVQIAKSENGGILKISEKVTNDKFYLGGTVYLFLDDNSVITCTDKEIRDFKDNEAVAFYTFSVTEMNKLKTKSITDIRFAIKGNESSFSSQTGNFIAKNKKRYFDLYDKTKSTYETEVEIRSLYK